MQLHRSNGTWYFRVPAANIEPTFLAQAHGRLGTMIGPIIYGMQDIPTIPFAFLHSCRKVFDHWPEEGPSHHMYVKDDVFIYFIIVSDNQVT